MGKSTDTKLRIILEGIAKAKKINNENLASFLINHTWNEFLSRKDFYEKIRQVLLRFPIDIKEVADTIKEKGFVVKGHSSLSIQTKAFFDSENAVQLLNDLIGDGIIPPDENIINKFINNAIEVAFKDKDGKRKEANAALFGSAILSSIFPKSFVDYRISRWKWMREKFDLEPLLDNSSIGAKLLWAGRIASEFTETNSFKKYFGDTEIEPNWFAAGLSVIFSKEPDINSVVNEILEGKTTKNKMNMPLNLILYGPPGTGKTYTAIERAVRICDGDVSEDRQSLMERFKKLQEDGRVQFVTFHQSYSYEEFVEGIRPVLAKGSEEDDEAELSSVQYELQDGIFKKLCILSKYVPVKSMREYDFDVPSVKIWKMSLGNTLDPSKTYIYDECIEENYISLGYGKGLDFSDCNNRLAVMSKLRTEYNEMDRMDYNITAVDTFKNKMQIGDIVIVSDGNTKFRAIGKVTGEYRPPADEEKGQQRDVEWLLVYDESLLYERILNGKFSQKTLYQLKGNILKIDALKELISVHTKNSLKNYVLIIDEINRGNISKILGELITLLEPDKRLGEINEITVTLPYSRDIFGVPPNLYILCTMNTADRSIAFIDTALRRRFLFEEMMPNSKIISKSVGNGGNVNGINVLKIFDTLNQRIAMLYDRDHQLGHSYFMNISSLEDMRDVFLDNIIPLLEEYFYSDWEKLCLVLGCPYDIETGKNLFENKYPIVKSDLSKTVEMFGFDRDDLEDRLSYEISQGFKTAGEEELKPFFSSVPITKQNTNSESE